MAWYITRQSYEDVSSEVYFDWPFSEEEVVLIDITFAHSGTAVFYTTGSGEDDSGNVYDPYGYLSESYEELDSYYGEPRDWDASNDDIGSDNYNFRIEYYVEAGQTYYLYVRHRAASSYGDITVKISPPRLGPDTSNIKIVERDSGNPATEIAVRAEGLDEDYEGTWIFEWFIYDEYGDKVDTKSNSCAGGSSNSPTATFSRLEPGTEYYIDVIVYYDVGDDPEDERIKGIYCTTADEDEGYYQPSYDDMNVDVSATDSSITVCVTGFDEDYDGVWSLLYLVVEKSTGVYAANITLRSDRDVNFNEVTFDSWYGITSGTTYQILLALTPYPGEDSGVSSWITLEPYEITTGSGDNFGAYIEFGSNTGTTITVSVKGLDTSYGRNDRYIYWSIDGVEKSPVSLSSGVPQSNSYTFTGLSPSTSYTIGARITYTSNGSPLSKELKDISCSTANWASEQQSGLGTVYTTKTASWTLRKATIFYASVKFSQSGNITISSESNYDTYGYLTTGTPSFNNTNGAPYNYLVENDDDGDGRNFSLTYAVESGVTYYIWVRGYDTSTDVGTITLNVSSSNRPELFKWADGTTEKMPRQEFDITADEWCDLLDNINAVRKYKGYAEFSQGSYTGTSYYKYFTYPTSGQPFRYQHYNQALNAITEMYDDGYDDNVVKQKDPVTAAKINLLVEWLNGIT